MVNDTDFLQALALVEQHPDVRVLHRLQPRDRYNPEPVGGNLLLAAYLDLETNSSDADAAEVVEVGLTKFRFDASGLIYGVAEPYQQFEQPKHAIPAEVTAIHGITNAMVEGQAIDDQVMRGLLEGVTLVIAHNADYDRKVGERRWPWLSEFPWACSYKQIDWRRRGAIGSKLQNIAATAMGVFYDAHRATDDVRAGIHVLTHEHDNRTALGELLDTTRAGVFRVYAHDSPFPRKGELKTRDYKWTGEKPWKRDFTTLVDAEVETDWLVEHRLASGPEIKRITAKHRYSVREEARAVPVGR